MAAFQTLDIKKSGYIMKTDFERALMEIGEQFTKQEINDMMVFAYNQKPDRIFYEDYINVLIVNEYIF